MAKTAYWWRDPGSEITPTHEGESDGQAIPLVFARVVNGEWEYTCITVSDGDWVDYTFGGYVLRGGKVIETIPSDRG